MNFDSRLRHFWQAAGLISVIGIAVSVGSAQPLVLDKVPSTPENHTVSLVNLNARYQAFGDSGNPRLLDELQRLAASRQQLLAGLVESNPGAVLRVALPAHVRASFPPSVQAFLEQEIETEGVLDVMYEDREHDGRLHFFLQTGAMRLSLHFAANPPTQLLTGSRVWVRGVRVGDRLALSSGTSASSMQTVIAPALPNTFGAQKTLVILVNFQDNASQPWTLTTAQSTVFTIASNFWLENSFQQTWLTGDVAGWYTMPISSTTCNTGAIQTYAQQAAQNAGYVLSNYTRFVYAFPQTTACGWSGYSNIGGSPSNSWVNGLMNQSIVNHELGHALGLYHSHSLTCGSVVYATSGCTQYEYGDYYETMGNSNVNGYSMDYTAFQKERLGWLSYSAQPPITSVSTSGSYSIGPYEAQDSNPKALKVLQSSSSGTYYYVEFRQALGFDHYLSLNVPGYSNVLNGVVVHAATPSNSNGSELLNMNPATAWGTAMALDFGQSYTDSSAGITISPTAVSSTGATVHVTLANGTCTPANPAVAISPAQSQWVTPGSAASFSVTVTNNDSASCTSSSFNLGASVPSGWSSALGSPALTLSPGGSASTTLQVTSPSGAASGFYNLSVSATNAAASAYTASASATYVVSACTPANPAVSISPGQSQSVAPGASVSFAITVTDKDGASCGTSSFNLGAAVPSGWSSALGSQALTLSPGGSSSATFQVTSPSGAAGGSYNVGASATNAAATSNTASASATYVISTPTCTHANPAIAISPLQSQAVAAGTIVSFTASVTNNDNSACSASSFNLTASVPAGWSGALGSTLLTLSPGASASTTLQVASPASAAAGSYNVGVSAMNSLATSYTGSGSAIYVVSAPVSLSITVGTNQASYTRGQTVSISVTVLSGSSPYAGASVTASITKSNGGVVTLSGTTGKNGVAALSYRLKKLDPTGTYQVQAKTSAGGSNASIAAGTTFSVH